MNTQKYGHCKILGTIYVRTEYQHLPPLCKQFISSSTKTRDPGSVHPRLSLSFMQSSGEQALGSPFLCPPRHTCSYIFKATLPLENTSQ